VKTAHLKLQSFTVDGLSLLPVPILVSYSKVSIIIDNLKRACHKMGID